MAHHISKIMKLSTILTLLLQAKCSSAYSLLGTANATSSPPPNFQNRTAGECSMDVHSSVECDANDTPYHLDADDTTDDKEVIPILEEQAVDYL